MTIIPDDILVKYEAVLEIRLCPDQWSSLLGLAFGVIVLLFSRGSGSLSATGNIDQSRAMAIAVSVSELGFVMLKESGIGSEWAYVTPTFWVESSW